MLPRKSVRDVALRCRWTLNQQLLKKRKPGEPLVPPAGGLGGAKKPLGAAGGLLPPKAPALPPVPMVSGGRQQREGAALGALGRLRQAQLCRVNSGWWQRQRLCCSLLRYSTRASALCCSGIAHVHLRCAASDPIVHLRLSAQPHTACSPVCRPADARHGTSRSSGSSGGSSGGGPHPGGDCGAHCAAARVQFYHPQ